MAYGELYYYTFKGLDGKSYECEILEDGYTGSSTEIRCGTEPFIVEYPGFEIFEPVRGSGAKLNLLSEIDRQFIGLYTPDMFKYQVILKKNGGTYWCGYLDTEIYREPFQYIDNYIVSFTASDGLAMLDRIYYLDSDGDNYTGIATQWEMITNCLSKLGLIWSGFRYALSISTDELTLAEEETIFHKTLMVNENWYNEDGTPETCRKVLEEILRPYGAFLTITENTIYLTDINTILSGVTNSGLTSTKFFGAVSWEYIYTSDLNLNIGDLSTLGFKSAEQSLNMVSAVNKQIVSYSPYQEESIIKWSSENDFYGSAVTYTTGNTNHQWEVYEYPSSHTWVSESYHAKFIEGIGIDGEYVDEKETYLAITPYEAELGFDETKLSFTTVKQLPFFLGSDRYKMKIEFSVYPRINPDFNPDTTPSVVQGVRIFTRIKIGEKKYHYSSGVPLNYGTNSGWVYLDSSDECDLVIQDKSGSGNSTVNNPMEDKWTEFKYENVLTLGDEDDVVKKVDFCIPLKYPYNLGGIFEFSIYNYNVWNLNDPAEIINEQLMWLEIKDVNFTIIDSLGTKSKRADIEYTGYLNPLYKNQGNKIITYSGYNANDHPVGRGTIFYFIDGGELGYDSYQPISSWTKLGTSGSTEELLLRSIISNYQQPRIELVCDINRVDKIVGYLTYNNYLSDKFMITGCAHDFAEGVSRLTMQSIISDDLNIEKSY